MSDELAETEEELAEGDEESGTSSDDNSKDRRNPLTALVRHHNVSRCVSHWTLLVHATVAECACVCKLCVHKPIFSIFCACIYTHMLGSCTHKLGGCAHMLGACTHKLGGCAHMLCGCAHKLGGAGLSNSNQDFYHHFCSRVGRPIPSDSLSVCCCCVAALTLLG